MSDFNIEIFDKDKNKIDLRNNTNIIIRDEDKILNNFAKAIDFDTFKKQMDGLKCANKATNEAIDNFVEFIKSFM